MSSPRSRPTLTRDAILSRAVALADDGGIAAVTMRKLASAMGVEAMSLYNHVVGKADLLAGMIDEIAGEFGRPDASDPDWQAALRRRCQDMHAALMRHPWAAPLILANAEPGPNMLAHVEATLACLVGAGFTYPQADHAWNTLDAYTYGYTVQRQAFPFAPEDYAAVAAEHRDMIPAEVFPHLREMTELIAARQHDGLQSLEFGLDILLDGLERLRGA